MEERYLEVLDPTTEPQAEEFRPAPRPGDLRGRRLGLLLNGKENADRILEKVAALLEARCGVVRTVTVQKSSSSRPVSPEQVEMLREGADLVLNGIGS